MSTGIIRVRAAAVFISGNRILVDVVKNSDDDRIWHIPPGGGVRYGESSRDALKREIDEELGWKISNERLIGSFESVHSINGIREHEISFVYEAKPSLDSDLLFVTKEIVEDNGKKKVFRWTDIEELKGSKSLLYPMGLLQKIQVNHSPKRPG